MAWPNFGGAAITSPEQAARQRQIAQALIGQSATPGNNWAEGLGDIAAALSGTVLEGRVSEAEAAGRERAGGLFADLALTSSPDAIAAALMSPDAAWASDAQTSIASALLNQGLERSDPLYQLRLQQAQLDYDQDMTGAGASPETYFGNPIAIEGPNGLQYGQMGNQGGFNIPTLPEGYEFLAPVQQLNTGTGFTAVDKFGNPTGSVTPIDNMTPAQDAALGTGFGQMQMTTIEAGRAAMGNNGKLDILEQTLSSAPQGAQGAFVQGAGVLGLPVEGLDDVQAAQAIINQLVPLQRAPGSGTMSDADLALFKQSLPAIINQPGGNAKIIATLRAINDYTIEHARIEEDLARKRITEAEAAQKKAAIANPLANYNSTAGNAPSPATAAPDGVIDWSDL